MEIPLNLKQYEAVTSGARVTMFIGGIGAGKSRVAGYWTRDRITVPESFGLIVAGTREQLRDSTFPRIEQAWAQAGIYQGDHFVVGRRPPRSWNVKPWDPQDNSNIVTFRWGAYAKVGSMDNYNAHRGPEFDWILGDEWRDWRDKSVDVLFERLRGKAFADVGRMQQLLLLTSPPDDPEFARRHFSKTGVKVIRASSYDNERFLPPGYLDAQADLLDDLTYDRDVLGLLISAAGTVAYYKYDDQCYSDRAFDPKRELYVAWDFNSGNKPMCCILIQRDDYGHSHAVGELVMKQSNTEKTCAALVEFLQRNGYSFSDGRYQNKVNITGDFAGHQRRSSASRTDYQIIREILNAAGFSTPTEKTRQTHRVTDRVATTNWNFQNVRGDRKLFVNPDACPMLHADLERTLWDDSGVNLDDRNDDRTHPSDAFSYYPYNYFPMRKVDPRIGRG